MAIFSTDINSKNNIRNLFKCRNEINEIRVT